jgi:hypothetical protein
MPTLTSYPFVQQIDYPNVLTDNIQQSSISIALDHIETNGSGSSMTVLVWFKDVLSSQDYSTLTSVMSSYSNTASIQLQSIAITSVPPNGAKTIVVNGVSHKLYVRNTGIQQTLVSGSNTVTFTVPYSWIQLMGAAVINCEALDTISFYVYDTAAGTYSGTPNTLLNQFGFTVNLPKDFYETLSTFQADLYAGMVISLIYTSASAKTVGFNILMNQVI